MFSCLISAYTQLILSNVLYFISGVIMMAFYV